MTSNGRTCCSHSRKLGRIHHIASAFGWLVVYHVSQAGNERAVFTEHLLVWALVEDLDDDKELAIVGVSTIPGEGYTGPVEVAGNFLGYTRAETMTEDIEAMFKLHALGRTWRTRRRPGLDQSHDE